MNKNLVKLSTETSRADVLKGWQGTESVSIYYNVPLIIVALKEKLGMNRTELAKVLKVTPTSIRNWELNLTPIRKFNLVLLVAEAATQKIL